MSESKETDNQKSTPVKGETVYSFPAHSIAISAKTRTEAEKKLKDELKKREEQSND